MLDKCGKCLPPNDNDSLTVDGECFNCSTNMPDKIDVSKCVKETLDSVSERLAVRVSCR